MFEIRLPFAIALVFVFGCGGSGPSGDFNTFIASSPDNHTFVVGTKNQGVQIWDVSGDAPQGTLISIRDGGDLMPLTPTFVDEETIVAVQELENGEDRTCRIVRWNVPTDKAIGTTPLPYDLSTGFWLNAFRVSGDGRWLFVNVPGQSKPRIEIWDTESGERFWTVDLAAEVSFFTTSHDGSVFAVAARYGRTIDFWHRPSKTRIHQLPCGVDVDLVLSSDGRSAALWGTGKITIVDLETGDSYVLRGVEGEFYGMERFSPDDAYLLARSENAESHDWKFWVFDVKDRSVVQAPIKGIYLSALSPDGRTLALQNNYRTYFWRTDSREAVQVPRRLR